MRRLLLILALTLALAGAVGVLYAQGLAGLDAEASRLRAEEVAKRQATLTAIRQELESEVKALVSREAQRPYYEYQQAFVPPDAISNQVVLVPSPLAEAPTEELISFYCEFRDDRFESPAVGVLDANKALRLRTKDAQQDEAPADLYTVQATSTLQTLEPLRASCVTTLQQGETAEPTEDVFDALITSSNRNLHLVLDNLDKAQEEIKNPQNGSMSQQALNSEWQGYQDRGGNTPQTFKVQAQKKARPKAGVKVKAYPFRPLRVNGDDGWPEQLLMVRRIEEGEAAWLQGFLVDVSEVRDVLLPGIISRLTAPEDEGSLDALSKRVTRSSAPPVRRLIDVLPTSALTASTTSLPLAPPFEGVALAWAVPVGDPSDALAGSSMLLSGALALVVAVFIAGSLILISAVRGQRRLAQQRADFVAALTHELKAPLTGVRALAELLHDGLVTDPTKQQEYYASMLTECDRLGRLVQNVLAAARLERGALPILLEVLDPLPILVGLADRFTTRLDTAGFEFKVELPNQLPPVRADRESMDQIVANLLDNAAKYGLGEPKQVVLQAEVRGEQLVVSVSDRGPGVPASLREEIFGRFYRSPDVPREIGGAGLGLAIARTHARAQGGELLALPREGGGARFELSLPLAGGSA